MTNIKLFESKRIRSQWSEQEGKWYFASVDVISAIMDSENFRDNWYRLKSSFVKEDHGKHKTL